MSGGRLVVLDRAGRDVKRYSLPDGLVTLGSDPACDIRVMLPTVCEHHATVVVRANQTIVRNISDGQTLVNGEPVSVAALKHGDTITLGDRSLRWEYDQPATIRAVNNPPSLLVKDASKQRGRGRKRMSDTVSRKLDPAVHHILELNHRASMPGGGKQVAIVQPQRRDALDHKESTPRLLVKPHRPYSQGNKRQRASKDTPKSDTISENSQEEKSKRKSTTPKVSPKAADLSTTKASMWIESRKSSPRNVTPRVEKSVVGRRIVASARKVTPLRTVVLRRAITPNVKFESPRKTPVAKVTKIQAPLEIDHTKQAALMLMAGHTHKSKIFSPKLQSATSVSLLVKKPSPVRKSPKSAKKSPQSSKKSSQSDRKSGRLSKVSTKSNDNTPKRLSSYSQKSDISGRSSRSSGNKSLTILEISDNFGQRQSRSRRSHSSPLPSHVLLSPKKSALKDPKAKKTGRKTDSKIQFDLSNLENYSHDSTDIMIVSNTTREQSCRSNNSVSDSEMSLHYPDTSQNKAPSPSPRRSVSSRSGKILSSVLGTTLEESTFEKSTLSPESPNARKSLRGSLMVQKILETPDKSASRYSSRVTKSMSNDANKTKPLSTRSPRRNVKSYSIVDLVSIDSNVSRSSSVYNSVRSSITTFGTPQTNRKTRSTINASMLGSSTPYVSKTNTSVRSSRASKRKCSAIDDSTESLNNSFLPKRSKSLSTPDQRSINNSRRSSSLCTPEDAKIPISVNSTRVSRASRKTLNDSVELLSPASDDSPVSSRRVSRLSDLSINVSKAKLARLSTLKSPNTSSKSPNPSPKSQNTSIQSLIVSPKSPRSSTISLRASTKPSNDSTKSPRVTTKSPRVSTKTSTVGTKSPLISTPSPSVSAKSPRVSNKSPRISSKSLRISTESPGSNKSSRISTKSPRMSSVSPQISTKSPRVSTKSPRISTKSPQEITKSPQEITKSPRTSSKSSPKDARLKLNEISRRSSRKDLTLSLHDTTTESGGTLTPENTLSPNEASTPMLSIRSFLETGQTSFVSITSPSQSSLHKEKRSQVTSQTSKKKSKVSLSLKRKTIGALNPRSEPRRGRTGIKSKSLNLRTARKTLLRLSNDSSNTSNKTDEGALRPNNDDTITPKSTVKLIQEAVKEKHSTAKKPQSKRSIIDNLNESDIVKQLFNSPVKRKLSQSMTEFSRKQSLEVASAKKKTRKTIALTGRTPDQSLTDHTIAFAPEEFVSPLNTPENSPNISAIKRLSTRNSSQTGGSSEKTQKPQPRTRKSVKNDLTNISGIKNVFAKSPRNSLSNVRGVKKMFAPSPANDLRRVSGVKALFQTQRKRRSPRNDLTNVRGVRDLFKASSPKNDLRNVSGVKKTLRGSPRNDLKDVGGVKRLFTREKSKDGLNDLSGVEELFDTSINSDKNSRNVSTNDTLFDQLIGKRTVKVTYSKSFSTKPIDKSKHKRSAKSLNVSFDLITNNVEDWLEKELQKRVTKNDSLISISTAKGRKSTTAANSKTSNKSKDTSKAARELQNLITDTVEGRLSKQTPRVRQSTMDKSIPNVIDERKSTSKSLSGRKSANLSKAKLPVKKTVLCIHSTPMKGQTNITADASVLGRVSPIVADKTRETDLNVSRSTIRAPTSPKPKPVAKTNKTSKFVIKPVSPKTVSPKKATRNTKAQVSLTKKSSPAKEARSTRGRKPTTTPQIANTKKGRASLVITKKQPILSPLPPSPKQTRKGRRNAQQDEPKVEAPKARTKKVTSPKPSPKMVTKKAATSKKNKVDTPNKASPKKTRTTRGKKLEDKPATPKTNRTRVNKNSNLVISKPSPQLKPQASKSKSVIDSGELKNKRGRRQAEKQTTEEVAPRRGRAKKVNSPPKSVEKSVRSRKISEKALQANSKVSTSLPAKRGRNAKTENSVQESKIRGRKTQQEGKNSIRGQSTSTKDIDISKPSPAKGRKRKAELEVTEAKSSRPKKEVTANKTVSVKSKSDDKKAGKTLRSQKEAVIPNEKATREMVQKKEQAKPVRGKKIVEEAPKAKVTRGRKRKSDPEPAPTNENKKPPAKRARQTAQVKNQTPNKLKSPVKSVRTRRQKEEPAASTSTSRSRRK